MLVPKANVLKDIQDIQSFFPSTPGTLDFPFLNNLKHNFQIQRFECRVLKSLFFSTPDVLDRQIVIAFPFFACFTGYAEAIFQIENIHGFFPSKQQHAN